MFLKKLLNPLTVAFQWLKVQINKRKSGKKMNDLRYKLARFFQGRTGVDNLGRLFSIVGLVLLLLTIPTHSSLIYFLALACIVYSTWRMLSKNYQKRYYENQKYLQLTAKIRYWINGTKTKLISKTKKAKYDYEQRKVYAIFKCPSCKQKLRAPKGRGKIEVTCNRCHAKFIRKV